MSLNDFGIGVPLVVGAACASAALTVRALANRGIVANVLSSAARKFRYIVHGDIGASIPVAGVKRARPAEAGVATGTPSRIHNIQDFPKRRRVDHPSEADLRFLVVVEPDAEPDSLSSPGAKEVMVRVSEANGGGYIVTPEDEQVAAAAAAAVPTKGNRPELVEGEIYHVQEPALGASSLEPTKEKKAEQAQPSRIPKLSPVEKLGYRFDQEGVLREIKSGDGFKFVNQSHYEKLGDAVTEEIYHLMCVAGLVPLCIPLGVKDCPRTKIFVTPNIHKFVATGEDNVKKVLILVHGSGAVRAGQWARSLCLNDSLQTGSMLPYIEEAMKKGYDVIVTNGNDSATLKVPDNSTPGAHLTYVWKKLVSRLKSNMVSFVAHSVGGELLLRMLNKMQDAKKKIFALAFTDSAHQVDPRFSVPFFRKVSREWVASELPLGRPVNLHLAIPQVSAGHEEHVWTSGIAFPNVFEFLDQREKAARLEQEREVSVRNLGSSANNEEDMTDDDMTSMSVKSQRGSEVDSQSVTSTGRDVTAGDGMERQLSNDAAVNSTVPENESEISPSQRHRQQGKAAVEDDEEDMLTIDESRNGCNVDEAVEEGAGVIGSNGEGVTGEV